MMLKRKIRLETEAAFLGLDQAFANSGYAVLKWDGKSDRLKYVWSNTFHPSIKWGHKSDTIAFLEHLQYLNNFLRQHAFKAIAMEGISFGSPGQASSRGGIWGLYSTSCIRYSDVITCAPRSLKLFVTGSGKAEKEDIRDVLVKKYKIEVTKKNKNNFDEYDAIGLAEVGFWSWRILNEGIDAIKPRLKPYELEVLWNLKTTGGKNPKPKGICNRIDDFYLKKILPMVSQEDVEKLKDQSNEQRFGTNV